MMRRIITLCLNIAVLAAMTACNPLEITSRVKSISLNQTSVTIKEGKNIRLIPTVTPDNAKNNKVKWTSSDSSIASVDDKGDVVGLKSGFAYIIASCGDLTARCTVNVVAIYVTQISRHKMKLFTGETGKLEVLSRSGLGHLEWFSSDESVVEVDDGLVTAKAAGTATVKVVVGANELKCEVEVFDPFRIKAVDLGLSVKWANANLGAFSEEDFGDLYCWGETTPGYDNNFDVLAKDGLTWTTYKWCEGYLGNLDRLTKYNTVSSYGGVDGLTTLEKADDAAAFALGKDWRMPTDNEWKELMEKCEWRYFRSNGIDGKIVTSKITGRSIFLTTPGYSYGWTLENKRVDGYYWSSSLDTSSPDKALLLSLKYYGSVDRKNYLRCNAAAIRPVVKK